MSFFKKIFGSEDKDKTSRKLRHPKDLRTGDIIKFSFLDQADISGKEFEVSQINTYIYGDLGYPEIVLKDRSSNVFYLLVEEEDGEEYLAISKKVGKAKISEIISNEDIPRILTRGTGTVVTVASKPDGYADWLTDEYKEVDDDVKGAFVKGDARFLSNEQLNQQERFSSYVLEDSEEKFALELEVYETGENELCVTVYHEIDDIEEMWPGTLEA